MTKRIGWQTRSIWVLGLGAAAVIAAAVSHARFDTLAEDATRPPIRGAMQSFVLRTPPAPVPEIRFVDAAQQERTLADFHGRVVLLNFWATWCVPCVKEMPALERLQAELKREPFLVLALSQDRAGLPLVEKFYREHGLAGLEMFADKTSTSARSFQLRGLPTSVLLDTEGREIGRLEGAAEWDAPEALALIRHFLPKRAAPPTTTSTELMAPVRSPGG
ncbi:MAG: TlpA family protein disulfide reductase [Proteobacteria bacterium]|nr:TlpA family protein disulfide reductase [Pseudomonadota bacterium]